MCLAPASPRFIKIPLPELPLQIGVRIFFYRLALRLGLLPNSPIERKAQRMTSYPEVGSEDHCGHWAPVTST